MNPAMRRGRPIIMVDGAGRPARGARNLKLERCSSRRPPNGPDAGLGPQCCYAAGHDGYHCDQNGLSTWFDPP